MICLLFSRIPKIHPHLLGLKLVMNVVNENAVKRLSKSLTNLNKKLPCVSYFFLFLTNQVLLINILFFCSGDPHSSGASTMDPFKTLFIARIVSLIFFILQTMLICSHFQLFGRLCRKNQLQKTNQNFF